ncbi:universal stress protein [Rasiella sp. SM2506]|uniref:universal stress protein n=1 Tax=Rasiella sp. SM2506 TaxID=3423914 RepID=UPI003D79DD9F
MKNILLPTDFSKNSLNAIDYAMQFFENWECDFYILNVHKDSDYVSADLVAGSKTDTIYNSIATDNKKSVNQLVKKLSKDYKSQSYTFHGLFEYDDFVSAVNQAVKHNSIDLIIMGSNGANGAEKVIFGSNTIHVIRKIECPTLIVPANYKFTSINKALFSTQRCEDFSFRGIAVFKEILNIHQCELVVLELDSDAIVMSKKEDNDCLRALFPEHTYTYFCLNKLTDVNAVNAITQVLKIDIHAAFVEKETFLERILFGSETTQLAYGTLIPLLCITY